MSSATTSKVSFTIRRPTPVSRAESSGGDSDSGFKLPALPRHLASRGSTPGSPLVRSAPASPKPNSRMHTERDSSDEDGEVEDELVMGFDGFGVQRLHEKLREPQGPLVIPALKNKDWREVARKRKNLYVPPSAQAQTGADGSVGGLGTRDAINSGPQFSGLQVTKRVKLEDDAMVVVEETHVTQEVLKVEDGVKEEETEDQRAIRLLLARAKSGDGSDLNGPAIEAIPIPTEDEAYRQDVAELPESATLEDYERVPVSQFGAALLRGMGWKEGTAASKKNKGLVEPWLPQARPALLGIGAKEREVFDDGSKKKGGKRRPEKRYVPVVKRERQPGESSGSGTSSRRRSPSPARTSSRRASRSPSPDRRRDRERRDADYDRDRDREGRDRDRERDRDRDRDSHRDKDRDRERDRDSDRRRDDRRPRPRAGQR